MDKNSVIGIILIIAVLMITGLLTRPSKEKIAALPGGYPEANERFCK